MIEQVCIRACTLDDIEGVIALERQWEQEEIAYGDFNAMSREAYVSGRSAMIAAGVSRRIGRAAAAVLKCA